MRRTVIYLYLIHNLWRMRIRNLSEKLSGLRPAIMWVVHTHLPDCKYGNEWLGQKILFYWMPLIKSILLVEDTINLCRENGIICPNTIPNTTWTWINLRGHINITLSGFLALKKLKLNDIDRQIFIAVLNFAFERW